jgi:pSer/pThr/pTyr-binding forkhead associated (FHA) protein
MKLIIEDEEGRRTTVPLVRDEISIGRQEGNLVRLPDRNVSRRHALLIQQDGHFAIEDLNSFNGVRVNGERISGRIGVREGDLIQIGDYDLAIARESGIVDVPENRPHPAADPPPPPLGTASAVVVPNRNTNPQRKGPAVTGTVVIQPPALPTQGPPVLRGVERPRLVLLNSPEVGREIVIERAEAVIGRAHEESDVVIDHPSLGGGHARLRRDINGIWRLTALGMAGGVKVNGVRHTETALAPGDVVQLGLVRMRFVAPGERFSLAGWREEQRRKERPYQIVMGLLGLVVVVLAVYVVVMNRRREGPVSSPGVPSAASIKQEDPAEVPLPPEQEAKHPIVPAPPPAPSPAAPTAVAVEAHGKTQRSHKRRGADEAGDEAPGGAVPVAGSDGHARGAALYEQGVELISDADYVGALGKLSMALDLDPTLADAHKAMGVCYAHLQEADKGAYHYEQYLKLKPRADDAAQVRRMLADYYKTRTAPQE